MSEIKNEDILPPDLIFATQPKLNWKFFINCLLDVYKDTPRSIRGYLIYDWLEKEGIIAPTKEFKTEYYIATGKDMNKAKSEIINDYFKNGILNVDDLKEKLRNS